VRCADGHLVPTPALSKRPVEPEDALRLHAKQFQDILHVRLEDFLAV
jgi:hypothetical protein